MNTTSYKKNISLIGLILNKLLQYNIFFLVFYENSCNRLAPRVNFFLLQVGIDPIQ